MERRVVVTHPAGSSILLIHPGSSDPSRNAAGRDGDLTGLIRPKISGQYGALRLGPGRSPRTVLSTIRVGVSTRGPNHLAPVAQTEEAAGPNPACARSNRVGGTSPVMLGWLSARFVRGSARVRPSPPALLQTRQGWNRDPVRLPARTRRSDRLTQIWRTIWLPLCRCTVDAQSMHTGSEHSAEADQHEPDLVGQRAR
jgi:hypothetical protein